MKTLAAQRDSGSQRANFDYRYAIKVGAKLQQIPPGTRLLLGKTEGLQHPLHSMEVDVKLNAIVVPISQSAEDLAFFAIPTHVQMSAVIYTDQFAAGNPYHINWASPGDIADVLGQSFIRTDKKSGPVARYHNFANNGHEFLADFSASPGYFLLKDRIKINTGASSLFNYAMAHEFINFADRFVHAYYCATGIRDLQGVHAFTSSALELPQIADTPVLLTTNSENRICFEAHRSDETIFPSTLSMRFPQIDLLDLEETWRN